MKPVAIFRHARVEGPGYLADCLNESSISWELIRIDQGDGVPQDPDTYSGLVFMGGPMSANDDLPWILPVLTLIRKAAARDIPVFGHCLGGQLMARALGGLVQRNPVKEIGWGEVHVADNVTAREWFGAVQAFAAFHWHGETFSLPPGAVHLLSSAYCVNQGFALGKHLALQCHVEMTQQMIHDWCETGATEIAANSSSPSVQSAETMQAQMMDAIPQLHTVARQLYQHWIAGLAD
jgi:GMP synthase-like glutamine amidotransferase